MTPPAPRHSWTWLPLLGGLIAISAWVISEQGGTGRFDETPAFSSSINETQPLQPTERAPEGPSHPHRTAFLASLDGPEPPEEPLHNLAFTDVTTPSTRRVTACSASPVQRPIITRTGLWGDRWPKLMPPWRS